MGKSKYVITVTRQFGSMGRPIAKKMAEKLGTAFKYVKGDRPYLTCDLRKNKK